MKKQINPTIKAYLIRGAFYLLLLLAVCAIPFALAQSRSRGTTAAAKPDAAAKEHNPPAVTGAIGVTAAQAPDTSQAAQLQVPTTSNAAAAADSVLNHLGAQPSKQAQAPWFFPNYQPSGIDCNNAPGIVIHDDGTIENGYSGNPAGGVTEVRFADKFTPTSYPSTYSSVCLDFVTLAGGPPTYPVDIVVYDDDGAGGSPGTLLGSLNAQPATTHIFATGQMPIWNSYNISGLGLNITSGSVYIGARWMPPSPTNVYMSADESTAHPVGFAGGYWWNNNANAWATIQTAFANYRSCMIRAVQGPAGPTPTGTPSPTPTATATPCTSQYTIAQIGGSIVPGTVDSGNHGDDQVTAVALPFSYSLYGQTFNSINVSSNGNAQFMTTDTAFTNVCPLPWATHNFTIFPYWDDQRTDAQSGCAAFPGGVCGVFTSISGTAPNRIFNLEWRTVYFADVTMRANYELRLYEGMNRFDVVWGAAPLGNTSATGGVQKDVAPNFTQYFCNGSGGATTGGQSYTLQPCGSPTPTPTATATATGTPTCTPSNSKIYNIAGFGASGQTTTTRIYNISTNTWTTGAPIPEPTGLTDHMTAYANGKIYVAGGYNGSAVLNTLRIYDIAANSWTTGAPMPNAVFLAGFGIINGKLYIAGGGNTSTQFNTLYIYDIATNAWTTGPVIPTSVLGAGSAVYQGKLYVYGGAAPFPTTTTITQIYDPVANSWSSGPPMNVARLWFYGGAIDNTSIVAPGGDTTPGIPVNPNEQLTGSWAIKAPLPFAARGPFAVSDGTFVYIGGGYDGTTVHADLLRYDPVANSYTPLAPSADVHFLSQAVLVPGVPCGTPTATPTASPSASATATFTPTPTAPATATPTATGTPSATPTCTPVAGQITTLFASNNNGSAGGANYFDVTVAANPITVTALDINTSATVAFSNVRVYVLPGMTSVGHETNMALWTQVATGSGTGAGQDLPTHVTLSNPFVLNAGTLYGIAVVADPAIMLFYTNGNGSNQNFSNADLSLALGSATNVPFTAPVFSPRVWNGTIYYSSGSCGSPTPTPTASPTCTPSSFHVLIAYSDIGGPPGTLQSQILAEPGVTGVDLFDASTATPTLAQLQPYNIVVAFSNNPYADPVAMGNVLADYADTGGVVVGLNFDWFGPPFGLDGRWITGGYTPFNTGPTNFSSSCLGTYDTTHPLMQGISAGSLCAFFRHTLTLSPGAVSVAMYQDSQQLCAYKTNNGHTGVGINAYLGENPMNFSGPFGRVVVNAGRWLISGPCGTPTPTPTASPTATFTPTATPTATATATFTPTATATFTPTATATATFTPTATATATSTATATATATVPPRPTPTPRPRPTPPPRP